MVGHYETVVDELCTRVRATACASARIVASTATMPAPRTRSGRSTVGSRPCSPRRRLRAGKSFFAVEGDSREARTYVGVFASAMPSHVTAQVRSWRAPAGAGALRRPRGRDRSLLDVMCYFNSLRELGRGATLVQADIREYLNAVWHRIGLTEASRRGGQGAPPLREQLHGTDEPHAKQRDT